MSTRFFYFLLLITLLFNNRLSAQTKAVNAFYYASEIVIDSKGNLFVSGKNNKIIKITPDGIAYHFAGHPKGYTQSKDGKGAEAMFSAVKGLAIDEDDNIYVADYNTIRKLTPDGVVTTYAGNVNNSTIKDGNRNMAGFKRPGAITVNRNGTIYVADEIFDKAANRTFNIIRKISPSGEVTTITNEDGRLFRSHSIGGLVCDKAGNLYVSAVAWSSSIKKITPDGRITTVAGVYNEDSKNRAFFKEGDIRSARIVKPHALAINPAGEIFFSDPWLHRILKISNNQVMIVAGGGGQSATGANYIGGGGGGGYADGKGKQASFESPNGIAFDKTGNLFVVDVSSNSYIRKLTKDGMVTTFCKQAYNPLTKQYEDMKDVVVANTETKLPETRQPKTQTELMFDSIMNIAMISAQSALNKANIKNTPGTPPDKMVKSSGSKKIFEKKFPAKKTALLATVSQQKLTRQQLSTYLATLYSDLKRTLPASKVAAAQTAITKLNDPAKIAGTAVAAWYKNAPAEAVLLISYAASQSPDDNTLNNCGAILNLCGLEEKALPILKYALGNQPGNSTLLNNIGQAYAGLGAKDSALVYLMACIGKSGSHPQACATAAYIEYEKGNTGKAVQLAEKAIQGGYGEEITEFYKHIKKDALLSPLLQKKYSYKKYFELNGFEIGPNCRNWSECETVMAKQQAFKKKLNELRQILGQKILQNTPSAVQNAADFMKWSSDKNWNPGPLARVAQELASELFGLYGEQKGNAVLEFWNQLNKIGTEEEVPELNALHHKYEELLKDAKGERVSQLLEQQCKERVMIDNKYFDKKSSLTEKFKNDWIERDMRLYDDLVFLTLLKSSNQAVYEADIAALGQWLLSAFGMYSVVICYPSSRPNCNQYDSKSDHQTNSPVFNIADCPIDIEIPLGVAKLNLDCSAFKLEFGEGIIFNYEKNFVTRESTIAVGVGAGVHLPGISQVELGAKEQLYIKFDKDNRPIDLGASWEIELDIKGANSPEIKAGYTIGINSGWNFEPGALKGLLGSR
jgi:tetratricopeptide (TPR) repeat protein/sugar lactone lactonase YvrE